MTTRKTIRPAGGAERNAGNEEIPGGRADGSLVGEAFTSRRAAKTRGSAACSASRSTGERVATLSLRVPAPSGRGVTPGLDVERQIVDALHASSQVSPT